MSTGCSLSLCLGGQFDLIGSLGIQAMAYRLQSFAGLIREICAVFGVSYLHTSSVNFFETTESTRLLLT